MNEKLSELVWALLRVLFGFSIAAHGYAILSDNAGWASLAVLRVSPHAVARKTSWALRSAIAWCLRMGRRTRGITFEFIARSRWIRVASGGTLRRSWS